jgi:tetratricopeptide (TPR) repeat protein
MYHPRRRRSLNHRGEGSDRALGSSAKVLRGTSPVLNDLDTGAAMIDRALLINPNFAWAWASGGSVRAYLGDPEGAIEHFARAMRLSPFDPLVAGMQSGTALAHFIAGRSDEAASWAEKAIWHGQIT